MPAHPLRLSFRHARAHRGVAALARPRCIAAAIAVAALLAIAITCIAAPQLNPSHKTIVLVRHAEKDTTVAGSDPPLSAAGRLRADELARLIGDTPLHAIYSTPYQRTRQTVTPLAARAGDSLTVIQDVKTTLAALRSEPWGSTVLVVGHSNSVPQLYIGLTGLAFPDSDRVANDGLWVVTLARDGTSSLLRLHYGAPAAFVR